MVLLVTVHIARGGLGNDDRKFGRTRIIFIRLEGDCDEDTDGLVKHRQHG